MGVMLKMAAVAVAAEAVLEEGEALFLLVVCQVNGFVEKFLSAMSEAAFVAVDANSAGLEALAELCFVLWVLFEFLLVVHVFVRVFLKF